MAEKTEAGKLNKPKPNPLPIIIGVVVVAGIAFLLLRKKRPTTTLDKQQPLAAKDPCQGLPDWACGTVALLDPLAKTSVDIYKAKAQSDLELARLKA